MSWQRAAYPKEIKTLGNHLKKRRLDLGLLQRQVAERLGVHEQTLSHWEGNETFPALPHWPAIIGFLGYDPRRMPESIGGCLRHWREGKGIPQSRLASLLKVDPGTLARWERGTRSPTGRHLDEIRELLGNGG